MVPFTPLMIFFERLINNTVDEEDFEDISEREKMER